MTAPAVLFPDAVLLTVSYLRECLTDVPVYSRVPETLPAEFVRIERLGGMRNTKVTDRPRIEVESWASTEFLAAALCARARAYMGAMPGTRGDSTVYRVKEVTGPQWVPDSRTSKPRYTFAVEMSTRGKDLE